MRGGIIKGGLLLLYFLLLCRISVVAQSNWVPIVIQDSNERIAKYVHTRASDPDSPKLLCGNILEVADFTNMIMIEKCEGPFRWNNTCYGYSEISVIDLQRSREWNTNVFYTS